MQRSDVALIRALCMLPPNAGKEVNQFRYRVLKSAGLSVPTKRKNDTDTKRRELALEYLRRKYGLRGMAARSVYRMFKTKVRVPALEQALGREGKSNGKGRRVSK